MIAVLAGSTAIVITRPDATAGPIDRAFSPANASAGIDCATRRGTGTRPSRHAERTRALRMAPIVIARSGAARERAVEFPQQPAARHAPVAGDGVNRDVEDLRGFFDAEAAEEPQLDHLDLARIERPQLVERRVERQEVDWRAIVDGNPRRQRHMRRAGAALRRPVLAREIDERVAHRAARDRETAAAMLHVYVGAAHLPGDDHAPPR